MSGATPYTDYLFTAPTLDDAAAALAALQAAGLVEAGDVPTNMLGSVQTITVGAAALTIRASQDAQNIWHLAVRTLVAPPQVTIDPAAYGLTVDDPVSSAAVLGNWFPG